MMFKDPIVADVRRIREKIARRFNYNLKALFSYLQSEDRKRLAASKDAGNGADTIVPKSRKRRATLTG
jgi:hypothetical protein